MNILFIVLGLVLGLFLGKRSKLKGELYDAVYN